jgi:hypothetical protein
MITTFVPPESVPDARSDTGPDTGPDVPGVGTPSAVRRFVGVVAEPRSYGSIAYLLLGLPLGTAWFAVLVTAASVGLSMLAIALLGIPVLWAGWYVVRAFANVERVATAALSGRPIPTAPLASPARGNLWRRLRTMSSERLRWRELAFLLLRFPVGIVTFTAAVTALAIPFLVAGAPFTAHFGGSQPFGDNVSTPWVEDVATSPWAWLLVPVGIALVPAVLHLLNALAGVGARWTAAWLRVDHRQLGAG